MHLLIDSKRNYDVDLIAREVSQGKRALKERPITCLYLDCSLGKKENGIHVLEWAVSNHCLPSQVVLITRDALCRSKMRNILDQCKYRTADGIRYIKH